MSNNLDRGIVEKEPFPHKIGSFALIFRKSDEVLQILLVKRRDLDIWNLPGGGADIGESMEEAVKRETREETGMDVRCVATVSFVYDAPRGKNRKAVGAEVREDIFGGSICVVEGGQLTCGEESSNIAFFSVEDLPPDLYERHRLLIDVAISDRELDFFIGQSISRHHVSSFQTK